jgi:DNA-binding PadR family transcriptional regulator
MVARFRPPAVARPLKPREYYVLLALAAGARHGLAIARDVEQLADGVIRLWPATLYGTLDELADRGWIVPHAPSEDESEKKRFFALAPAGRRALAAETARLAGIVKTARARMRRPGEAS